MKRKTTYKELEAFYIDLHNQHADLKEELHATLWLGEQMRKAIEANADRKFLLASARDWTDKAYNKPKWNSTTLRRSRQ